jgi:hypothetical protein
MFLLQISQKDHKWPDVRCSSLGPTLESAVAEVINQHQLRPESITVSRSTIRVYRLNKQTKKFDSLTDKEMAAALKTISAAIQQIMSA